MSQRRFCLFRAAGQGRVTGGGVAPTPTPTPAPTYPAWFQLADAPAKPPAQSGGSATVTPANFAATIAGLSGTEGALYCAGGDYGSSFNITKVVGAGQVRLAPADPANPPYFNGTQTSNSQQFRFTGAKNLWFDGWEFRQTNMTNDTETNGIPFVSAIISVFDAENIRISRGKVKGGLGATYGIGVGVGVNIAGSIGCQVDRVALENLSYGVRVSNTVPTDKLSQNIYIGFLDFNRANGAGGIDFCDLYGVDRCLIEYCEYWDSKWKPDDLHADFVQLGVVNSNYRGSSNVLVRKCLVGTTAAGTYTSPAADGRTHNYQQGVWISDATGANDFPNIIVEDNEFYGPATNAISQVEGPQNFLARRNKVFRSSRSDYQTANGGGGPVDPRIWISRSSGLGQSFSNVSIEDNIVSSILLANGATANQSGNSVPGAALDDAAFMAAKATWEANRALYY